MDAPSADLKPCCLEAFANDTLREEPTDKEGLIVRICPEGHRHYELSVDTLELGIETKGI